MRSCSGRPRFTCSKRCTFTKFDTIPSGAGLQATKRNKRWEGLRAGLSDACKACVQHPRVRLPGGQPLRQQLWHSHSVLGGGRERPAPCRGLRATRAVPGAMIFAQLAHPTGRHSPVQPMACPWQSGVGCATLTVQCRGLHTSSLFLMSSSSSLLICSRNYPSIGW